MLAQNSKLKMHGVKLGMARWGHYLAALGGYLVFSLLLLAPLLPAFSEAIPGGPVAEQDGWQNVWNLWWVHEAMTSRANPFHSPYLYYPDGVDLYLQTLNISNGLLALPITAWFGPIAAYNAVVLLAFVLAGLGGYAFGLSMSGNRGAAFVGGLVFTFSPFHMTKLWDGQLELIALQWLAFYALFLLRAAEGLRWRDAILAGLFLTLIGYTSWYYLFFCATYTLLFAAIWLIATPGWTVRRALLLRVIGAAALSGLLLLPIEIPAILTTGGGSGRFNAADPLDPILIHSANLLDFALPSYLHPLWGVKAAEAGAVWHPYIAGWNMALGYGALGLAAVGGIVARRTAWRWWCLALAALVLALGPLLHVGQERTSFPLPYTLLLELPGIGIARRPSHFVVIATLMFVPLTSLGVSWLLKRLAPQLRWPALALLITLLAFEYAPPRWPLQQIEVHPYYQTIKSSGGAVLELPPPNESSRALQAQLVHRLPILGGFVSRTPRYPFAERTPGVRQLWSMAPDTSSLLAPDANASLVALNFYNIRHVIVHWEHIAEQQRPALAAALAQALPEVHPAYQDNQISVYRIPRVPARPIAFFGTTGWYPEEQDGNRHWRWMQDSGEIVLINPTGHRTPVTIHLRAESYQEPRQVGLSFDTNLLGDWLVKRSETALRLQLLLPPGEHTLQLRAPVSPEQNGQRTLSIVILGCELL